jgi:hypothetical protein
MCFNYEILGSHCSEYEDYSLLGSCAIDRRFRSAYCHTTRCRIYEDSHLHINNFLHSLRGEDELRSRVKICILDNEKFQIKSKLRQIL